MSDECDLEMIAKTKRQCRNTSKMEDQQKYKQWKKFIERERMSLEREVEREGQSKEKPCYW